ncbi:MAG: endonuclease/exonuclease/phosphatase family protein [Geobacteraceae bacterium]|nr:endonuclease/exonuclease/phosphatase family protein [Geobacteraceae bacterium]
MKLFRTWPARKASFCLIALTVCYGGLLAAITILNGLGADRWWFGALNLYLPQAMWLAPGAVLACLALKAMPRWCWLPGLCILWVLGPIMGFCWPLHSAPAQTGGISIRVMTCNAKYGKRDVSALIDDMLWYKPDLVFLQDASGAMNGPLKDFFRGWSLYSHGQYVTASRLPLSRPEVLSTSFPGEKQDILRCRLTAGGREISLYNVHFQTPREGLNAFRGVRRRPRLLPAAVEKLENNVQARFIQAGMVREYLRQDSASVILAGDLNSPDSSHVMSMLRKSGLHDAFAESGTGYGYTYGHFLLRNRLPWLRVSWMRIDHIMSSRGVTSKRSWTGTGRASDHRPVLSDMVIGL